MTRAPSFRPDDESGFSLVELLVATLIMATVTTALGFAVVSLLRSSVGARDRVSRAQDTMMSGYLFPNDVTAATAATLDATAPCGSGSPLITLTTTNVASGSPTTVWYGVSGGALLRTECAASAVASSVTVVDPVTAPTVECQAWSTSVSPDRYVTAPCTPWAGVDRIQLQLTLPAIPGAGGSVGTPARDLTLVGARS